MKLFLNQLNSCSLTYWGTCISYSCYELKTDGEDLYFWHLFNYIFIDF